MTILPPIPTAATMTTTNQPADTDAIDQDALRFVQELGAYDGEGPDEPWDRARTEPCFVTIAEIDGEYVQIYSTWRGPIEGYIVQTKKRTELNKPTMRAILKFLDDAGFPTYDESSL